MTAFSLADLSFFTGWSRIVSGFFDGLFIPVIIGLFAMYSFLDTNSFTLNLKSRRDRGFYVYKELCQFLFKLARRCIRPSSLPADNDNHGILQFSFPEAKAMVVDDFKTRSKLGPRLDLGCKQKAEKKRNEGDNKNLSLEEITANNREEFGRSARGYVVYLVGATQKLNRFTSDIVRGLGSFDLEVLLVDPVEQAMYCFKQLFSSFRLRGVVDQGEEPVYTEEYLSFIDELRRLHPGVQQPKLLIADAITFISSQGALKTRRRLTRIFRLCCLCLDEPRFSFPGVRFDSARTDDPTCSMFDVVAPIQSFLGSVSRGLDALTSEASISRFLHLEPTFGGPGLESTYSPWDSFNHFGRQQIRETLSSSLRISSVSGTGRSTSGKSPKVVRISPGKPSSQRSATEADEAPISKSCDSSGSTSKL